MTVEKPDERRRRFYKVTPKGKRVLAQQRKTFAAFVEALALRRVMSSLLFGIGPMDPAAYAAALGVTLAAATLASYVPARRAATIDPMLTMKVE